jgi:macrolide transport system ATP-binding/permease protein
MIRDFFHDLRYGLRALRRGPGFAAIVVLTLGLGIGANAAIFSLLDAVLLRAVPVPDPDSLAIFAQGRFRSDQPMDGRVDLVPYDLYKRLRAEHPAFTGVAAQDSTFTSAVVQWAGPRDEAEGNHALRLWVSGNYFDVLGLRAVLGRALQPADDVAGAGPVMVLSHLYWQRRFGGDPGVIGGRVTVNGQPHTVVGVMPPGFIGLDMSRRIDFWVPIQSMRADFNSDRAVLLDKLETRWLIPLARLAPGVSRTAAEASVNVTLQQYLAEDPRLAQRPEARQATRFVLDPGGQGISMFRNDFRTPLTVLMVGVALLLLIVCLNVSHLLLARTAGRQREISVRAAVGASRARLVRQLLAEALLMSALGALVGLVLMRSLSNGLITMATSASRFTIVDARLDGRTLVFTALVTLAAALLLGLVPAIQATRLDVQRALRESSRGAGGGRRLGGQLLLSTQVAFSLVLLVGAGLMASTLRNLRDLDRGFDQEHVLLMWVSTEFSGFDHPRALALQDEILRRVGALPGVEGASLSFGGDVQGGGFPRTLLLPDGTPRRAPFATVTPGYFATAGLRLVGGRAFTRDDRMTAPPVAIINETLARQLFGDTGAVGRSFRVPEREAPIQVVGVLRDVRTSGTRGDSQPMAYIPAAQSDKFVGSLEVRTHADPALIGDQVRRVVLEIQPNLPVRNIRTAKVELDRALWRERLLAALSSAFALTALFLACVGLYGVVSQWAAQRTREIGVRMALGATAAGVRWLVLRQALVLVGAGVAVGLPAAVATARLLQGILFGVQVIDPAVLTLAALLLFAVAAAAAFLPARRASRVHPMAALRNE